MNLLHKRKLDYMNRNTRDMNQLLPENNGNSFKAQEKQIKPSRQSGDWGGMAGRRSRQRNVFVAVWVCDECVKSLMHIDVAHKQTNWTTWSVTKLTRTFVFLFWFLLHGRDIRSWATGSVFRLYIFQCSVWRKLSKVCVRVANGSDWVVHVG